MSVWIPDARLEMPELLVPMKQPRGKVAIDFLHPLARGLRAAYIPANSLTDNLVTNSAKTSSTLSVGSMQGRKDGLAGFYTEAGAAAVYNPVVTNVTEAIGGFTILAGYSARRLTASSSNRIGGTSAESFNGWRFGMGAAGSVPNQTITLSITFGGVADYAASTAISGINTNVIAIGGSFNFGATSNYFLGTAFSTGFTVGTASTGHGVRFFGIGFNSEGAQGEYYWAYYWSRALSEAECQQVAKDPYQFLIPQ